MPMPSGGDAAPGAAVPAPPGWLVTGGPGGQDGVAYPPPPWQLAATMLVSVFLLPRRGVPAELSAVVPDGVRPLTLAGRAIVGVAFVSYAPGGVIAYDELLVALPGRGRPVPACTVGQIWVDSPASRAGARALWAIPKELAAFTWAPAASGEPEPPAGEVVRCAMTLGGREVARLEARVGRRVVPGVAVVPLATVQALGGRTAITRNRLVGQIRRLRPVWTFRADGPLGYLAGLRPRASVAVTEATVAFGLHSRLDGSARGPQGRRW